MRTAPPSLPPQLGSELSADNPFAMPRASRSARPTPSTLAWAYFAGQRLLRVVALPVVIGMTATAWRLDAEVPAWLIASVAVASGLVWVPTTIWLLNARFLRPSQDDRSVLMRTGEVLDREAFKQIYLARAVEIGLMAAGLLAVGVGFTGRFGVMGLPVLVLVMGFSAWTVRIVWAQLWYADAVSKLHEGNPERCLLSLDKAGPAGIRRATLDHMAVLMARARLHVGDLSGARASLTATRDPVGCNADIIEAQLDAGHDIPPPDELLVETSRRATRILELTVLRAVWALQLGDPDTALSQVHRWENTRDWLPWMHRTRLDLLAAAAHQQRGENEAARGAMVRSGVRLADRVWMRRVYPKWWRLMEAIEEDDGWRDWNQPSRG